MKNSTPVMLIPGLACTQTMWSDQIKALSLHTEVFVPDLPVTDCLVKMTSAILKDAPRRCHVVGSSMGGYIALEMAKQAPESVETLSLMVTTPEPDTDVVAGRRRELQASVEAGQWEGLWRSITPRFVSHTRKGDSDLIEAFVCQISETCPKAFLLHQTAMMKRASYVDFLAKISCPTNVIIGEDDAIIPPDIQERMADQIRGARTTYIENCGHIPSMEKPGIVTNILCNWVREHNRILAA